MIKPKRSCVFLGRPISMALWKPASNDPEFIRKKTWSKSTPYQKYLTGKYLESNTIRFLLTLRGKGTKELASMRIGEEAELIGPLGNSWGDFLPKVKSKKPIALVGGGIGIAPLHTLFKEGQKQNFTLYAGFKTGFKNTEEKTALLGSAFQHLNKIIIATEDGTEGQKGFITDFLLPENFSAVCACGPEPMLKTVAKKCKTSGVPCFVSLERRMACGVGACLGCTVKTVNGNRRCCADGPIFNAEEVFFDE